MKMSPALIIGALLILIGLSTIIKVVFNIDFPVFKILFALLLIFWGISILLGRHVNFFHWHGSHTTVFSESDFAPGSDKHKEYQVVFGKANYDLTGIDSTLLPKHLKFQTVFGETIIKINKNIPVRITAETAFGNAELPDGNSAAFGSARFQSDNYASSEKKLDINVHVAFGQCKVIRQ